MLTRAFHIGGGKFTLVDSCGDGAGDLSGTSPATQGNEPEQRSTASEFMLGAVATCFGQALLFAANRLGMDEPEGLVLSVEGHKDKEKFQLGELVITVEAGARQDDLEHMTEMAKRYCFVSNSLTCPVRHVVIARS